MTSARPRNQQATGLFKFSNELIELVIGYTHHQDLVSITTTCRLVHELAKPALSKHQVLLQEMSSLTNYDKPRGYCKVFDDIINEPNRALYFRELAIWPWESKWVSPSVQEKADAERISEAIKDGWIRQLIDRVVVKTHYLAGIIDGDEEPVIGLTLAVIPYLVKLVICPVYQAGFMHAILQLGKSTALFPNLKTVEVRGQPDSMEIAYKILNACSQIPSVDILIGIRCNFNYMWHGNFDGFPCNMKYLELRQCTLSENAIYGLVSGVSGLKRFAYTPGHGICAGTYPQPRPKAICDMLLESGYHSLEALEISGLPEEKITSSTCIAKLQDFECLQDFTVDFDTIFPPPSSDEMKSTGAWHNLSGVLPGCLRKLNVHYGGLHPGGFDTLIELVERRLIILPLRLEVLEVLWLDDGKWNKLRKPQYEDQSMTINGVEFRLTKHISE